MSPYVMTEDDLPARFELDLPAIKSQDNYGHAAFELLKEASMLVIMLVHAIPSDPFQRNDAIRRGLIKRLSLLGKSLLSDICHNSGYQQETLARQIVEAAANYFYLADDDGSGARYDAYVLNTLAEEKASLAIVAEQIETRGGDTLPIESRMRRSNTGSSLDLTMWSRESGRSMRPMRHSCRPQKTSQARSRTSRPPAKVRGQPSRYSPYATRSKRDDEHVGVDA